MDLFPNETVIFQWLLFMTALFALHFGVFRPVLHLIQERKDRTSGERERVEQLNKRIETLVDQCNRRLEEGRKVGIIEKERLLEEAERAGRQIVRSVQEEIERELEKSRTDLDRQARTLSLQLKQFARDLGNEITAKVLRS